ncbi:bifunctional phosphopantothenoylcysteine decarboxylase/phosphopantothenate--cysteine ligase CoaBC [Amphibacillus sp. MSJ-3]|uniref:bifunctional phosphopantothenoylcysteine decarboxylase/phosphopantothenate--cysteine ligase CoaBC n=1 Tax=Amphibacillus sp. MSJ-3 TaxID=2841505 RepID=UPI001C0EB515|nr:bifunctional phosphopantothenoylcysteine decarboxylase/phosphopantothenate--cysteine ligase CoaBC [Amphibacillus sp. MSJ-3]MBU5594610.1 bifunctional phosphopantothenoylcysteine decarboxylase/phosphopantothenate--cysteine ligase CoaBC [Amphibacillus sp. MSJ-3]
MLTNKKIVLGVTGGIAAYKAIALTSKLSQAGALVQVILTKGAQQFVSPLSFQAISRQPVYLDTFDELDPKKIQHIDLADWADLFIVAPATANIIGKYANGIADDMLSTTLLATKAPVYIAPAMNVDMYQHPAVQNNLAVLEKRGVRLIDPNEGYLACGYTGKGRLAEPEEIVNYLEKSLTEGKLLEGKKLLITAGPTQEKIDPVRYLTNYSSGKMGFAIAEVAANMGADVTLVSGPVALPTPRGVKRIDVVTTEEMYQTVLNYYPNQDIVIKAAAVSDYRPAIQYQEKLKKQAEQMTIELKRNKDILLSLGQMKEHQYLVGFAAETRNVEQYGQDKLSKKNLDAIVINDVSKPGIGFGADNNEVLIIMKDGTEIKIDQTSKLSIASQLLTHIAKQIGVERS